MSHDWGIIHAGRFCPFVSHNWGIIHAGRFCPFVSHDWGITHNLFVRLVMCLRCKYAVAGAALIFVPELKSCEKIEVDNLGSPSLIVRTISEDVKYH